MDTDMLQRYLGKWYVIIQIAIEVARYVVKITSVVAPVIAKIVIKIIKALIPVIINMFLISNCIIGSKRHGLFRVSFFRQKLSMAISFL